MKFALRSVASIATVAVTFILAGAAATPSSYAADASVLAQEETMGKATMGKDTMSKDAMSKDAMGKDTMAKDSMNRDEMNK